MAEKQAANVDSNSLPGLPIHKRARVLAEAQRKLAAEIQATLDTLVAQKKQLWEKSQALQQVLETLPASGEGWVGLYDGEQALDDCLRRTDLGGFLLRHEMRLVPVELYVARSGELFAEGAAA